MADALPEPPEYGTCEKTRPLLERITIDPEMSCGKPCIRGTRHAITFILEQLSAGATIEEYLADIPHLEREDVLAALCYAARLTRDHRAKSVW